MLLDPSDKRDSFESAIFFWELCKKSLSEMNYVDSTQKWHSELTKNFFALLDIWLVWLLGVGLCSQSAPGLEKEQCEVTLKFLGWLCLEEWGWGRVRFSGFHLSGKFS